MARTRRARAAGLLLGVVVALATAVPAGTAAPDGRRGPDVLRLQGHGYGHGHGMSQYGAQGAALQGLGWRRITSFYYPGTAVERRTGLLRVQITADTTTPLVVEKAPDLVVRDLADGRRYHLPARGRISQWRLVPAVGHPSRTAVQRLVGTTWTRWRVPGRGYLRGDGQLFAGGPLTLVLPDGSTRAYRGALRSARTTPGGSSRDTVNVVRTQAYLRGVVPAEVPATWEPAAVRAQAVAARTYAWFLRGQDLPGPAQLCDTTSCQVYLGVEAEHPASDAAVRATLGRVLTSGGEPAFTQFGSSSGGWTSAGGPSYLPARRDPYDGWRGNPVHSWTATVPATRLEQTWPALGDWRDLEVTRREGAGRWGGRALEVTLRGSGGDVVVSGETLRSVLGLRSTYFAAVRR